MDFLNKLIEAIAAYFAGHKPISTDILPDISPEATLPILHRAITPETLVQIYGCPDALATAHAPALSAAMDRYDINTPLRMAHFLAQIGYESGRLRYCREVWGPTPAQIRYEGRADLGNIHPGDGKRFMGRGLIQLTGRANYSQASQALGVDFVGQPELLEQPEYAALSAAWFWHSRDLNRLADSDAALMITKRINGGTNGLDDRLKLLERAKRVLMP